MEEWKMEVFWSIFLPQTIVLASETSSNMASTPCQKLLTPFWPTAEHFILFGLSDYVQILLACGIIMELQIVFQTFDVSICNGNKKYPIGTLLFFTQIFAFRLFHVSIFVANRISSNTICNALLNFFNIRWQNLK